MDQNFATVWSTHLSQLLSRPHLDNRTRFLILTCQHTVTKQHEQLEENLNAARNAGVAAEDLLEVILQAYVYTGPWTVAAACESFERVLSQRGETIDPLRNASEDAAPRNFEAEHATWSANDASDPRLDDWFERYGWEALSNGLRLRPGHHINMVDVLDALDPDFLQIWEDAAYTGMYGRSILDDETRLLCVVGATLALGETHQSRRHMRAALRAGALPRELLEVIFHTTAFFGHPYVMPTAFDDLIRILDDEGRIAELIDADRVDEVRRIVAARVARRDGVQDDISAVE